MTKFPTRVNGDTISISIPRPIDSQVIEEFISESKVWLLQPMQIYILDFSGHDEIKPGLYRPVLLLQKCLAKNGRYLASIGVSREIQQSLVSDGVASAFAVAGSVDEAQSRFKDASASKTKAPAIDGRFIKPFVDATLKTLAVQAKTEGKVGKPYIRRPDGADSIAIDIAGLISLASEKFKGNIMIGFPAPVFLKIYESMFDEKKDAITAEIQDAAAEILNIIYGMAKTELNREQGCDFKPALPTVLCGEKLTVRLNPQSPSMVLPFESTAGPFLIEVTIEKA